MSDSLSIPDIEAILLDIKKKEDFINDLKTKRDQSISFYQQLIFNAKAIFDDETKDILADLAVLKNQLERYFADHPPKKGKSLKFAAGSFGYNNSQTKFFLFGNECDANNPDLLQIVKNSQPQFLKTKEYVDWANLKKNLAFDDNSVFFKDSGEVINGLFARKAFSVKTS